MDRKTVIELFRNIEKSFPVYDWKYGDISLWPIVKKDLFNVWYHNSESAITKSRVQKTNNYWFSIKSLLYTFLLFVRCRKKSILFFGADPHRVQYQGKHINRYFYPLIKDCKLKEYAFVEYGTNLRKDLVYPEGKVISYSYLNEFYRIYVKMFRRSTSRSLYLPDINLVSQELLKIAPEEVEAYFKRLPIRTKSLLTSELTSKFIVKRIQPKEIYELCYYNNELFMLNYVSSKYDIKTFDVQHGGQGALHPMYNFVNTQGLKLNTLPSVFWCWDENNKEILSSMFDNNINHQVVVKGNPWIDFVKKDKVIDFEQATPIVLLTMQEETLDDYILNAIELLAGRAEWWIRFHPRMLGSKTKVSEQLLSHGILKLVEIERANCEALPHLLNKASVHVSKFSGSIIEGRLLDVPTIILEEIGAHTYRDYLNEDDCISLLNPDGNSLSNLIIELC